MFEWWYNMSHCSGCFTPQDEILCGLVSASAIDFFYYVYINDVAEWFDSRSWWECCIDFPILKWTKKRLTLTLIILNWKNLFLINIACLFLDDVLQIDLLIYSVKVCLQFRNFFITIFTFYRVVVGASRCFKNHCKGLPSYICWIL